MLKIHINFIFEGPLPRLSAVGEKMTEICSLPVLIFGADTEDPIVYSAGLAFECLPKVKLDIFTCHLTPDNEGLDERRTQRCNSVCLRAIKTDLTLLWTTILALEALGGKRSPDKSDENNQELHNLQRQKYNCQISVAEMLKRHRKTVIWESVITLLFLILSPIMFLCSTLVKFWDELKSLMMNLIHWTDPKS